MANATVMGMVFGQPKRMKTSMVASAFPNALWIPGEGMNAIKSVTQNEWGFEPTVYEHPVRTVPASTSFAVNKPRPAPGMRLG